MRHSASRRVILARTAGAPRRRAVPATPAGVQAVLEYWWTHQGAFLGDLGVSTDGMRRRCDPHLHPLCGWQILCRRVTSTARSKAGAAGLPVMRLGKGVSHDGLRRRNCRSPYRRIPVGDQVGGAIYGGRGLVPGGVVSLGIRRSPSMGWSLRDPRSRST